MSPGVARRVRGPAVLLLAAALVTAPLALSGASAPAGAAPAGGASWPSFGNGPQHDFTGPTTLTPASAPTLHRAWSFHTGDAVTASPTVVGGVAYFGSWDTKFYAVDVATGSQVWSTQLDQQTAITPYPGENPRDVTSDGGLVTSSAWYQPAGNGLPALVIFGGGYTLYALDAATGAVVWKHVYDGLPEQPPSPTTDDTRIFSSPVVADGKVLFGVDPDQQRGLRGYIVAADLATGDPDWEYQTDVDAQGDVLNDGCGGVWSSGTVLPDQGLVVFPVADCHDSNAVTSTAETALALRVADGTLAWQFKAPITDNGCDFDLVGTNAGVDAQGRTDFLGIFGKSSSYYSVDPATGALRWQARPVFGGGAGGFIGSPAYDGHTVYGATAIGDVSDGGTVCDPGNPRDTQQEDPSFDAIDAATGRILWQADHAYDFGATTEAGGLLFSCLALAPDVDVRLAATGQIVATLPLPTPCWGGVTVVGDTVLVGVGSGPIGNPAGVVAFTPSAPSYALGTADGSVLAYPKGSGDPPPAGAGTVAGLARTPDGRGTWLVNRAGAVYAEGDAPYLGSMGGRALSAPVVGLAPTPDGKGYWLVGADGAVYAFGDAPYLGSMGGRPLNAPVVGLTPTPDGRGYWLVGADGGVFAFGDAPYLGSMGGRPLAAPVTGVAADPAGPGYWLSGADGGVFAFGTARYLGSMGGRPLSAPVVGMAAAPDGGGYWMAGADGAVYALGDAPFLGSARGRAGAAVVGVAAGA
jgi:hypothetical protein